MVNYPVNSVKPFVLGQGERRAVKGGISKGEG